MSEMDLAKSLFGASTAAPAASMASASVRYGVAVSDSSDGKVELLLDGNADDSATVTLSCDVDIAASDRVKVISSGGRYVVYALSTQINNINASITNVSGSAAAAAAEAAEAYAKAEQAQSEAAAAAEEAAAAQAQAEQAQEEATAAAEEAASATEKAEAAQAGTSTAVTSVDVEFAISTSSATAPESGWQTTAPEAGDGEYVWQRTKVETPSGTTYTEPFCLTTYAAAGADGVGVESIVEQYYLSSSSTTQAGGSWVGEYPGWEEDKYLWTRSVITYTDGSSTTTDPVCVSGTTGATGAAGADGVGISGVTEYYAVSSSNSTAPTSWVTTMPTLTATNRYLWNYEKVAYSDGTSTSTTAVVIGMYSEDGVGISGITEYYLVSSSLSGVTTSTSGWSTSVPTLTSTNRYLWNYEVVTYTDGTTDPTDPVVIGVYGDTGAAGADGEDGQMLYAVSSDSATDAAKDATLSLGTLTLSAGATVAVTFANANTAANPTLNVASTGAKAVYTNGVRYAYWEAGATVVFTYTGSYWYVASTPVYANTATIGNSAAANIYIDADSVDCRTGTTVHSSFSGDGVELYDGSGNLAADFATESCNFYQNGTLGTSVNSSGVVLYDEDGAKATAVTSSGTTIYDSDGYTAASFTPSGCNFYNGAGTKGVAVNSSGTTVYNSSGYRTLATTTNGITLYQPTSSTGTTQEAAFTKTGVTLYASGTIGSALTSSGLTVYSSGNKGLATTASGVTIYDPSDGSTEWASFTGTQAVLGSYGKITVDPDNSYKMSITNNYGSGILISAAGTSFGGSTNVAIPACTLLHTADQTISSTSDVVLTMGSYRGGVTGLARSNTNYINVAGYGYYTPICRMSGYMTFYNSASSSANVCLSIYQGASTSSMSLLNEAVATVPAGGYVTVSIPTVCYSGTGYFCLEAHVSSGGSVTAMAGEGALTVGY